MLIQYQNESVLSLSLPKFSEMGNGEKMRTEKN